MTDTDTKTIVNTAEPEPLDEVIIDEDVVIDKSIQKPKKPRTQKQIDAFKRCQEVRNKKNEEKRMIKEANRKPRGRPKKVVIEPEPDILDYKVEKVNYDTESDSDSDSEELEPEIIYKKKPKRRKKNKKLQRIVERPKKIVYLSSSDSDSDDDYILYEEDDEPKILQKPRGKREPAPRRSRPLKYSDVIKFM